MFREIFSKGKKNKYREIKAVQSGKVIDITKVPDVMFSKKTVGDGVAIIPESGEIYSPVSGVIEAVANTNHAYGIRTNDDIEVLIHIGLETVELEGEGFGSKVKIGDKVEIGDLIGTVDLKLLEEKGYNNTIAIILTNANSIKSIDKFEGIGIKKETTIITYKK